MKIQAGSDIINLGNSHALILPHCPDQLKMDQVMNKMQLERKEINSLGLFDSASPNFTTYYPGITEKDLKPELDSATLVYPIFRALSQVTVHKNSNPIDFSKNNALKNSLGMLRAQSVYPNHEMLVGNELGVVFEEVWQNSYTTNDGIKVPAGINVKLKLDGQAHPSIVRGIMMEPPSIHSVSVTVEFAWEPSHPKMDTHEFWSKLGSMAEDGEQIRRIVTLIKRYHEISLVAHGADPWAQKVNEDGKINNPIYASKVYNTEGKKSLQVYTFDYKDVTKLTETPEPENDITLEELKNQNKLDMNYLIQLAQSMGIDTTGKDEAQLQLAISTSLSGKLNDSVQLGILKNDFEKIKGEKATLAQELETAKNEKAALEADAKVGKDYLAELRETVIATLNSLYDNKPDATLLTAIQSSGLEGLKAFNKTYSEQLEAKSPLHCQDCKSVNVSRQTAELEEGEGEKQKPASTKLSATVKEAAEQLKASKKSGMNLYKD